MDLISIFETANKNFINNFNKSVDFSKSMLDIYATNVAKANDHVLENLKKVAEGKTISLQNVPGWEYFSPKSE